MEILIRWPEFFTPLTNSLPVPTAVSDGLNIFASQIRVRLDVFVRSFDVVLRAGFDQNRRLASQGICWTRSCAIHPWEIEISEDQ